MSFFFPAFLGTTYYALYVQFHPKIGNVWIRMDSNKVKRLQLQGLFDLMKEPFKNSFYWKPENWDLNWVVTTGGFIVAYNLVKELNFHRN